MDLLNQPPLDVARTVCMPKLGLPRVGFYRRDLDSGNQSYVVVFTEAGRQPYHKWIRLRSALAPAAQKEAYSLGLAWHRGTYDPWQPQAEAVSLVAAVSAWMDSGRDRWSKATVRGRRGVLNLLLAEIPGARPTRSITTVEIERFLSRASLGPVSRRTYLRVLNTFFRWCKQANYLDEPPTVAVEQPRVLRSQVACFTYDELVRFVCAAEGHYEARRSSIDPGRQGNFIWITDLTRFAVATGLRKGELRHLRWADVNARDARLIVRSYDALWQGKPVEFRTKNRTERVLPVFPMAAEVLRARRRRRVSESPDEPVFLGPRRNRLGDSQINKVFRQVRTLAGLPSALDLHACRHTFASWLLSEGETLYRVSRWLGHVNISMTADLYGHFTESAGEVGERVFAGERIT